jgi:hypothetical protein
VLTGCESGPDYRSQVAALPRINTVEPGDTTMSCDNLKSGIQAMDDRMDLLRKASSDASSSASTFAALGALGAYTGSYTPAASFAASEKGREAGSYESQISLASQRRNALTLIYNQRCF